MAKRKARKTRDQDELEAFQEEMRREREEEEQYLVVDSLITEGRDELTKSPLAPRSKLYETATAAERVAAYVERRQERGEARVSVWVPERDKALIKVIAKRLIERYRADKS